MAASKPKDTKKKRRIAGAPPETTFGAVLFYAVVSGLSGVILAIVFFASFSPQAVPDEATLSATVASWEERPSRPGDSVFLRPQEGGGAAWEPKVAALTSGDPADVRLSAEELNGWLRSEIARVQPVTGSHRFLMVPRPPGFAFFSNGSVQFSLSADLHFFGTVYPVEFIADGRVDPETGGLFDFERLRCNAAEIPPVPGLRSIMIRRLMASFVEVDGYVKVLDVLGRARTVEATEQGIRIVI